MLRLRINPILRRRGRVRSFGDPHFAGNVFPARAERAQAFGALTPLNLRRLAAAPIAQAPWPDTTPACCWRESLFCTHRKFWFPALPLQWQASRMNNTHFNRHFSRNIGSFLFIVLILWSSQLSILNQQLRTGFDRAAPRFCCCTTNSCC